MAFITGSRCYGSPKEDSDLDLAVLLTDEEAALLRKMFNNLRTGGGSNNAGGRHGGRDNTFYFSGTKDVSLNLLVFTNAEDYHAWRHATRALRQRSPVSRDEAIACIEHYRHEPFEALLEETNS